MSDASGPTKDEKTAPVSQVHEGDTLPDPYTSDPNEGVSVLDFLLVLVRNLRLIVFVVFAFSIAGVGYALLAEETFTSRAQVVREAQPSASLNLGGLSGLSGLGGLGMFGGAGSGLTVEAYPSVLRSREVRLAVVRDTFRFPNRQEPMTFVDYHASRSGGLLSIFKNLVGGLFASAPDPATLDGELEYPTEEEEKAILAIEDRLSTHVDAETGLMTVAVSAETSRLAAVFADRFLENMTERIRKLRTEKERETLAFIHDRFKGAEEELREAEIALANFIDRNQNPTAERLRVERDRLERQVRFKSSLYSELQNQLSQAELQLKRTQPVLTVVERPTPPMERSSPQRKLVVIAFFLIGVFLSVPAAFARSYFSEQREHEQGDKLAEIQKRLQWGNVLRDLRGEPVVDEPLSNQNGADDTSTSR